ncbi:MAG: hypothetical protein CVT63_07315 [Candidatus Anoxymicrobium japonicum]|uniref:Uncharacterized protein n=1 Tax=Candidatus Anoxymicrobium japonicum TaxID=2013648 RepID=A0A2N3G4A6_9ACTN|nr:MAG: hypothetical protein CVT63_07315 [Candidatus Anoxymicrobium japonicum]
MILGVSARFARGQAEVRAEHLFSNNLFLAEFVIFPPNPVAKKLFEAERKFVYPVPLGEYRVRHT